jgi:outer membrane protein TolC
LKIGNILKIVSSIFLLSIDIHGSKLGLDRAIKSSIETHPDIKSALLLIERSKEGVAVEKSSWFPQLTISAEYDPQRSYTMPANGELGVVDDDGWSVGISLRQNLFDFSRTHYRVKAAETAHEISQLGAEDAKSLMRYRVKRAYSAIILYKEAIVARRRDMEAKRAMLEQAKALAKRGLKTRADELRFKAALEFAKSELESTRASLRKSLITMEQLTGIKIDEKTILQRSYLYKGSFPKGKKAIDRLMKRNRALAMASKNEESLHATYEASRRERYGSVDIVGDINHLDTLARYDATTIGIRYTAPIYQGGRLSAMSQRNRIDEMVARQKYLSRKRALSEEYLGLYADWKAASSGVLAQKAGIESSKEALRVIEARYREGMATYIDVLDAQATLLSARLGLLNAYYRKRDILNRVEYLYGE